MKLSAWQLVLCAAAPLAAGAAPSPVPALGFVAAAPGSYALQRIMAAPEGLVLDSDARTHRLSRFVKGKVTLFSFIYTYCTDAKGCPLAYATLHSLKTTLDQDPKLREQVRFVSMSFDPRNDTPEVMRLYGGAERRNLRGVRWHFLTTQSGKALAPLLDGFGQDVAVAAEQPPGQRVPVLQHMLKVYLIDAGGSVREIYSTSFLHPTILLNDIKTLLLERPGPKK